MSGQMWIHEFDQVTMTKKQLRQKGLNEAANRFGRLFTESGVGQVMFSEVAGLELGVTGDSVPREKATDYALALEVMEDDHKDLREAIEERFGILLVTIDEFGRPTLRGGNRPHGFALRTSQAGRITDRAGIEMARAKMIKTVHRQALDQSKKNELVDEINRVSVQLLAS